MARSSQDAYQRTRARRSTLAGVGGISALVAGVVLTLAGIGGDVLPTVLAIGGAGSLLAAVATGAAAVMDNFRYGRNQSDDD